MISTRSTAAAAFWLFLAAQLQPTLAQISGSQGCWSSPGDLVNQGSSTWTTSLSCSQICGPKGAAVIAVKVADCYCGDLLPPKDTKVDDSQCQHPCQGFPDENCGGDDAWSVYLLDPSASVGNSKDDGSSGGGAVVGGSSSSDAPSSTRKPSTTVKPSVVLVSGKQSTVVQTIIQSQTDAPAQQSPAVTDQGADKDGGSNTGGIVAGVVVGVVALIAIILGTWWFLRKRRARHDGHQRVQSTNAFATAGAGPGHMDTRLDPSMVQRRDSTGSVFADNQDYSRRILRVANPDNR